MRLLLFESDQAQIHLLEAVCELLGPPCDVAVVRDVPEAVQRASEARSAAAMFVNERPYDPGHAARWARAIREEHMLDAMPLYILTVSRTEEELVDLRRLSGVQLMPKGYSLDEFVTRIGEALGIVRR